MWSIIELNVAIICACLITIKPLVARVFPRGGGNGGNARHMAQIQRLPIAAQHHDMARIAPWTAIELQSDGQPLSSVGTNSAVKGRRVSAGGTTHWILDSTEDETSSSTRGTSQV